MNLAKTFQAIEETRFLKKLSFQEQLFFVGEVEPLKYIQEFFANLKQANRNFYYDLPTNSLDDLDKLIHHNNYQAIIVVSMENEISLFSQVKQKISDSNINITIIRLFADIFINLLCQRDLLQSTSDDLVKPKTSYAILTTPRSGSTYFCDLLSSTGIAGYPTEHLRLANQELALNCNFDYLRLLNNLMQYRTTNNGVFGTKLISHFLFELKRAKPNFRDIFQSIDKYIILVRQDKVAQAVSLVLAQKTEVWHIQKSVSKDNLDYKTYQSALENIEIEEDLLLEVKQKHQFIINQENRLRRILDVNQIEPLEIIYEEIVKNTESQIEKVCNFLEISHPLHQKVTINSEIQKMPSDMSQKIIRQFYKSQTK
jgi:trehalose 2-sulfotransferase